MSFEKDEGELKKALYEIEQRIKKLQEHKEDATKQLKAKSDDKAITETVRRLEHNLDKLEKKRRFLMQELEF